MQSKKDIIILQRNGGRQNCCKWHLVGHQQLVHSHLGRVAYGVMLVKSILSCGQLDRKSQRGPRGSSRVSRGWRQEGNPPGRIPNPLWFAVLLSQLILSFCEPLCKLWPTHHSANCGHRSTLWWGQTLKLWPQVKTLKLCGQINCGHRSNCGHGQTVRSTVATALLLGLGGATGAVS